MRRLSILAAFAVLGACAAPPQTEPAPSPQPAVTTPVATPVASQPATPAPEEDPYLWLEEVEGERAMTWVKEHNAKSLATLQGDPRYERYHDAALKIVEATDRIANPQFRGDIIYNFWQDPNHVRGILRKTTLASYVTANPKWTTVLDVD